MAYNYHNEHCHQCGEFVYKGEGKRIWVPFFEWVTMCNPCASSRTTNKNKAVSKKALHKSQPTLF
jgi:hypothetical protein